MSTSTSKGTINPLSKMRQMLMDPGTKWDHIQPAQMAKLFLNAHVSDLDITWAKFNKVELQNWAFDFLEWKPSMLMDVEKKEYHTYFPMIMEMNTNDFRCVACRYSFPNLNYHYFLVLLKLLFYKFILQ